MKPSPVCKRILIVAALLAAWLLLMLTPIGNYIAMGTILVLIVVFFVIGCIDVHQSSDRL